MKNTKKLIFILLVIGIIIFTKQPATKLGKKGIFAGDVVFRTNAINSNYNGKWIAIYNNGTLKPMNIENIDPCSNDIRNEKYWGKEIYNVYDIYIANPYTDYWWVVFIDKNCLTSNCPNCISWANYGSFPAEATIPFPTSNYPEMLLVDYPMFLYYRTNFMNGELFGTFITNVNAWVNA